MSDSGMIKDSKIWWKDRVGYEIYPRTFCDSNGDGIGDLKGIESKLDYLAELGVGAIWICPFYPSPGIDCGYDVSNYCDVDSEIGTLDEFDSLVKACHERNIAILIDIVPNHTSDQYELFRKAIEDPSSAERDFYIFRDKAKDGGPPNNWLSVFGGSAWKFDDKSGQYYLHMFYPEQPDLNWRNPAVHEMFEDILRFWFDRGIDGFRVDVTQGLYKHPDFPNTTEKQELPADATQETRFANMDDSYYYCLPETPLVFERWKEIAAEYNGVLIGEMVATTPERLKNYFNGKGLDLVTLLTSTRVDWVPEEVVDVFDSGEQNYFSNITWMMSNHDYFRAVTRFGGGALGLNRVLATTAFTACLSGFPFIYYGEELGWEDGFVEEENFRDPRAIRFPDSKSEGRDPFRTNMVWDASEKNAGFSDSEKPWLISALRDEKESAKYQQSIPGSAFARYKEIMELRKLLADIATLPLKEKRWIKEPRFLGYECGDFLVGLNTDTNDSEQKAQGEWELIYSSTNDKGLEKLENQATFYAESTCVFKRK